MELETGLEFENRCACPWLQRRAAVCVTKPHRQTGAKPRVGGLLAITEGLTFRNVAGRARIWRHDARVEAVGAGVIPVLD